MRETQGIKQLGRILPGLIVGATVVVMMQLQAWTPLERAMSQYLIRWRGPTEWDNNLVMISVDDQTLQELGQFPISRSYYADLLEVLTTEQASVVSFNILFSDEAVAGSDLTASRQANARLAQMMKVHGRVVIGQVWGLEQEPIMPIPVLAETAIAVGHLRQPIDPDGLTREVEITYKEIPSLGVATVQAYGLEDKLVNIPTQAQILRINWPAPAGKLATLSLIDVLNGRVPTDYLKGKIVIVGFGATTGQAPLRTPFDRLAPVPAGYMHAAVVDNLLNQNWLRLTPDGTLILALLIATPFFSNLLYARKTTSQIWICTGAIASWLSASLVMVSANYLLPVVAPIVAVLATGAIVVIVGRIKSNALWQVRSTFLNTMSHEIRTPLNAIVNISDMLRETPLNDRQREFADILHNSSQTLLALINDVLDFSKIESGQFMLEEYPVTLSEAIERSIEMLAPHTADKDLELVYAIAPNTPRVIMSDPVRLQQILLNLISNAVKFTEAGEIAVRVQASDLESSRLGNNNRWWPLSSQSPSPQSLLPTATSDTALAPVSPPAASPPALSPNARPTTTGQKLQKINSQQPPSPVEIRFAVSDTGIGIPSDRIAKLFQPFTQGSASTTRKYGGTGLGLSISKRLSERMGGNLWARSYLGEGSTFFFTVQARPASNVPPLPGYLSGLSGTRLLLIDRNDTRRDRLRWTLTPLDIDLSLATNLTEALEHLIQAPAFDGIILDEAAISQEEDCACAITALREAAQNEPLPIILLSALKNTPPALSGDTIILWKPVKQVALHQALRSIRPVTLPAPALRSADSHIASTSSVEKPSPTISASERNHFKILIAEDNHINQRVVLRILELLGYQADVADSGKEVLMALEQKHYDVILMDMWMPELDGIETTRQIRQRAKQSQSQADFSQTWQNIWIIAMTANAMARDRQRCYAAGMDDYLSKPINREALDRALQRCPAIQPK